jgi:hypothetical protein
MAAPRTPLSTVEMAIGEYLANPRGATAASERAGFVAVKDEQGRTVMVLSSNRASELLLDDE